MHFQAGSWKGGYRIGEGGGVLRHFLVFFFVSVRVFTDKPQPVRLHHCCVGSKHACFFCSINSGLSTAMKGERYFEVALLLKLNF